MIKSSIPRVLFLAVILSILSGCGTLNRVGLQKDSIPKSSEARLIIPQDEIIIRSKPSNISTALGGGLIPALIDASITKSRQTELEKISTPFYNETAGIDLRTIFFEEFKTAFELQKTLPDTKLVVTSRALSKGTMKDLQSKLSPDDSLMAIRIWHEFSSDAKKVIVIAGAYMGQSAKEDPVYRNMIFYLSKSAEVGEGDSPFVYWSENKGERLKQVYSSSASIVAKLLVEDLASSSNEEIKATHSDKEKTKVAIPPFNQQVMFTPLNGIVRLSESGYVMAEDDTKKIIRGDSGVMYWIEK